MHGSLHRCQPEAAEIRRPLWRQDPRDPPKEISTPYDAGGQQVCEEAEGHRWPRLHDRVSRLPGQVHVRGQRGETRTGAPGNVGGDCGRGWREHRAGGCRTGQGESLRREFALLADLAHPKGLAWRHTWAGKGWFARRAGRLLWKQGL